MIVNVRGTSGSGKSTLAREVIAHYGCVPAQLESGATGSVLHYYSDKAMHMMVVGKYARECGGCDTIKTQDEVVQHVCYAATYARNVLFEGAVVSTIAERYLRLADDFRGSFIFAILDTPLETCLERVRQRRQAKGNTKPLNTYRTEEKFRATTRFAETARNRGYRVITLDHTKPLPQLLEVLT